MQVKSIFWRKNRFSQLRRMFLGINADSEWKDLQKDHALEWGDKNKNPGVWRPITNKLGTRDKPTIIKLSNSINELKIWSTNNPARGNYPKISQRLWKNEKDIIENWYYMNFKITKNILISLKKRKKTLTDDQKKFYNFINKRLAIIEKINNPTPREYFSWICKNIEQLNNTDLEMNWFYESNLTAEIEKNINNTYLLILNLIENDEEIFVASGFMFGEEIFFNSIDVVNIIEEELLSLPEILGIIDLQDRDINLDINNLNLVKKIEDEFEEEIYDQEKEDVFYQKVYSIKSKALPPGPISKPKKKSVLTKKDPRDRGVAKDALEKASYKCELNSSHLTFVKNDNQIYMEPHHVIPISKLDDFSNSIDVAENILCLCPLCHRMIHSARNEKKKKLLEKSYKLISAKLKKSNRGIDISLTKLFKYYKII